MVHYCHALDCNVAVPPKLLFCLAHWRLTPPHLQRMIWKTYVPGQEIRKDPTEAYLLVQRAAVYAVAIAEGRIEI